MEVEVSSTLQEIISKLNLDILITLEQVDTLLNSILFAKQNILHPQVLKPSKLIANLKEIVHSLPTEREFPIPLTANNGHTLLEISTLQVYYSETKLIFIIIIPLTEILTFDIFHLYPLPIPLDENQYQLILPDYEYLLITKNRRTYVQYKNFNDNCKQIFPKEYLCTVKSVVTRRGRDNCELLLLQNNIKYIPKNCNVKIVNQEIFLWQNLPNNNWILATSKTQEVTLNCKNKNVRQFTLKDTNILHLEKNCKAYISYIQLLTETVELYNITDIVPIISIQEDCCDNTNFKNSKTIHFDTLQPINLKLEELQYAQHQLHKLSGNLDD